MINGTVLIVDGRKNDLAALKAALSGEVKTIITIGDAERINEVLERNEVDIVLLEMNFRASVNTGNEGLYWMKKLLSRDKDLSIILMTAGRDVESAVAAIREGATDLILKPWNNARLISAMNAAWRLRQSKIEAKMLKSDNQLLKNVINKSAERIVPGASPTMINVMNIARKVASTDANVLITGENGTGKELVAREIHRLSPRSGELMITVDMGSVTESLFESEMFGHVKGAFTDARDDRAGKIEAANGSTLFLDEIGNLSLASQSKLLNVLQSRKIVRVGSNREIPVSIRLICATNRNLRQMIASGEFREDLYYRINTIMLEVPPLRDRVDDIPILASHFLKVFADKYDRHGMKISTPALEKLSDYDWPGNVRELQHTIEKAVILSDSAVLKPSDFSFTSAVKRTMKTDLTLEEMEKRYIEDTLHRYGSNMSIVAGRLGITRQTLYNKVRKYGLK